MIFNNAFAQGAESATSGDGGLVSFLPFVLIIVLFYFLLIRPQQKRSKEHRKMLEALAVGDEVISSGGILGKVDVVGDSEVTLDLGGVKVRFQKSHIQAILPKGTLNS